MSDNKNGQAGVPFQWLGRVYQVSAEGQQWEAHLTAIGQFTDGPRELATMTVRFYEGGLDAMRALTQGAANLVMQLATQKATGLVIPKV